MIVSFDLDNVIFDMDPMFKLACKMSGQKFKRPISYDIYKSYDEKTAKILEKLFCDDVLYTMPLLDKKIPYILNDLMQRPDTRVVFVTERRKKQPKKTFQQLRNAGINCVPGQVYDTYGLKSDVLKQISPDVHYDDSPDVIGGCLEKDVPVVMISHAKTPYNHFLRECIEYYPGLRSALRAQGLYKPKSK